ncbi:hypothetical protein ACLQ2J_23525 [Streptomyces cyaneofuscatus]|uniref:hypothetical protein n=1 Tax=Streptomyces cyaneofuscatus TaxID=66883 RepID=UPI003CEF53B2
MASKTFRNLLASPYADSAMAGRLSSALTVTNRAAWAAGPVTVIWSSTVPVDVPAREDELLFLLLAARLALEGDLVVLNPGEDVGAAQAHALDVLQQMLMGVGGEKQAGDLLACFLVERVQRHPDASCR